MASGDRVPTGNHSWGQDSVTINVISPSLPAPSRFRLENVLLSSTLAQLRSRIAEIIPTQPAPSSQRLIYRGKPLTNNQTTVGEVLGPLDGSEYTIHLVLPPSPAGPSVQPSSVGGSGIFNRPPTSRPIIPGVSSSQTEPSIQGIRHRGQAAPVTSNAQPPATDDRTQRDLDVVEYVLRNRDSYVQYLGHADPVDVVLQNPVLYEQALALFNASRRSINTATTSGSSFAPASSAQYGLGTSRSYSPVTRSVHGHVATPASHPPFDQGTDSADPGTTIDRGHFEAPSASVANSSANRSRSLPLYDQNSRAASLPGPVTPNPATDIHENFHTLAAEVRQVQEQMIHHIIPSVHVLFRLRTQILDIRDERRRNPGHSLYPLEAHIEGLYERIMAIYQRVDERILQLPWLEAHAFANPPPSQRPEVYLASSPNGYQGLVVSQGTATLVPPGPSAQPRPAPLDGANPAAAGAVENIVRQAVLNQQRRQNNAEGGLGHHIRRIWLFVRLYFFCYMISDTGTWTRILLVSMAVLVALFSDTDLPRQLHGMVVAPVQRHLEGLAHMGGPADQPAQAATNANTNPPVNRPPDSFPAEIWQIIRRAERSLVLLLASLVPGIGERQVEARNAAEAEAERGRQEQEQERERQREQAQSQAEQTHADPAAAAAADNAGAATSPTQQPQATTS